VDLRNLARPGLNGFFQAFDSLEAGLNDRLRSACVYQTELPD
jgi:hypothetical protein